MADIIFSPEGPLSIRIDTNNIQYYKDIEKLLKAKHPNYMWMPAYKSGGWDGCISFFNKPSRSFPYGLLPEVLKFTKEIWGHLEIKVDSRVKELFYNSNTYNIEYDLKFYPYWYQKEAIETILKFKKGIIRSVTASGKSLIVSYISKILYDNGLSDKQIIIVPSLQLVGQFYDDMIDYGIDASLLGRVGAKWKEFDNPITISTWQSLQRRKSLMKDYTTVIIDEVHAAKGQQLRDILKHAVNAEFRMGTTGTLPDDKLSDFYVKSYIGGTLKEYTAEQLGKENYIAKCNMISTVLHYSDKPKGNYHEVRDEVFTHPFRLNAIEDIIKYVDGTVLVLVEKVEKEGQFLLEHLEKLPSMKDKEVVFLSGSDKMEERDKWKENAKISNKLVLIVTYGIFQQGINIPNLKYVILATPSKAKIRVLQSIGRSLRKHEVKDKDGAFIFDLCDNTKYLDKHTRIRHKHYDNEGFNIIDREFYEGDEFKWELW